MTGLSLPMGKTPDAHRPSVSATVASDADILAFRANLHLMKRDVASLGGKLRNLCRSHLPLPLAVYLAMRGVGARGRAIKEKYGVRLRRQFRELVADYARFEIRPEDYYLYQLYLPGPRQLRARHFGLSGLYGIQEYLIERERNEDYPYLSGKHRFAARCATLGLPAIPILAEFEGGARLVSRDGRAAPLPDIDLFSKPAASRGGHGANLWRRTAPGHYVNATSGASGDADFVIAALCAQSQSSHVILQPKIANHAAMRGKVTRGGVSTVRLVTCRNPAGALEFLPPVIRMPIGDSVVDNLAQGGLAAPIDIARGTISGPAVRKDKRLGIAIFERHPDTGAAFMGFQLPHWEEVCALGLKGHTNFRHAHFIAWDIAILDEGLALVEANPTFDIDLTILPHRISLADTPFIPYYNHFFAAALQRA
jgi:Sugar-transfer associated ATP-grasp